MDYRSCFDDYCTETGLRLHLSFDMPEGYETANGTFDLKTKTVFINAAGLENCPDFEKLFYLFHELRHASQFLQPERFDELLVKSCCYVIMYNGVCFKLTDGTWQECKLEGSEEFFTKMYLGQPYEKDANSFAYSRVSALLGDSRELQELHSLWVPKGQTTDEMYRDLYDKIDSFFDRRSRLR